MVHFRSFGACKHTGRKCFPKKAAPISGRASKKIPLMVWCSGELVAGQSNNGTHSYRNHPPKIKPNKHPQNQKTNKNPTKQTKKQKTPPQKNQQIPPKKPQNHTQKFTKLDLFLKLKQCKIFHCQQSGVFQERNMPLRITLLSLYKPQSSGIFHPSAGLKPEF